MIDVGVKDVGITLTLEDQTKVDVAVDDVVIKVETGGAPGPPGADSTVPGPQGEVSVGTTTTLAPGANATVTDSDSSPNRAVLNFGIPRGPIGPAGPTAVSTDIGNTAVLGTDSLIFVPASAGPAGGDLSGNYPNPSVVDDSHAHTGATISNLDAGDTTTGTFAIGRIPTGTTNSTVAVGDHLHTGVYEPSGTVAAHVAAADPHTVYLKPTEVIAGTNVTVDTSTTPGSVIIGSTGGGAGDVPSTRTITAGTGLTGGGDLSADRTISLDTTYTDNRYVNNSGDTMTGSLTVVGNITAGDALTPTKAYRLRTSGGALDFEAGGAALYLSVWTGADYTGTQYAKMVMENGANITQAIGEWQWRTSPHGTVKAVMDTTGKLVLGADPTVALGAATKQYVDGRPTGTTILSGTAAPTDALGASGNYYVDIDSQFLYGPKAPDPTYGSPQSIQRTSNATETPGPLEFGNRFTVGVNGRITGLMIYSNDIGEVSSHVLRLWSDAGVSLGTATTSGETAGTWKSAYFGSPILVNANDAVRVSFSTVTGEELARELFTSGTVTSGDLTLTNACYSLTPGTYPTNLQTDKRNLISIIFEAAPPGDPLWEPAISGIPPGGTSGQVLQKTSGTDYATGWVTPSGDVPSSRTITSGNGLTGGGDLSADRTLAVGAGAGITVSSDSIAVDTTTIATRAYVDAATASGLPSRSTVTFTTASLADAATETGVINLAMGYRLLRVATTRAARIRLYTSTAARTADASRPIGTAPTGDHGVMLDFVTTSGDLDWGMYPPVEGFLETGTGGTAPTVINTKNATVTDESSTSKSVPLDFTPTSGNRLIAFCAAPATFSTPSGWTRGAESTADLQNVVFHKVSDGTETTFAWTQNGPRVARVVIIEIPPCVLNIVHGTGWHDFGVGSGMPAVGESWNPAPTTNGILIHCRAGVLTGHFPTGWTPTGDQTEHGDGQATGAFEPAYLGLWTLPFTSSGGKPFTFSSVSHAGEIGLSIVAAIAATGGAEIPYSITNVSGSTGTVGVDLTWVPTEA